MRKKYMQPIHKIAKKLNITQDQLIPFGRNTAKVDYTKVKQSNKRGKLILVTAMSPTKFGEGKTTTAIGLADGLTLLGKKTVLCLREPSLGPLFSQKGGAAGGGKALVEPSEEINLHFTGDIHAITTAHNLISAEIDNHIHWGNRLGIKEVFWKRSIDLCDRKLRGDFNITASSEVMAVFCLSKDFADLKKRLSRIVIGIDMEDKPVTVGHLKITDNIALLLKYALNPNLVQTAEGTPALIHGGPFANIAHGTNSLIADTLALSSADFTVTEAGFGSDLGAFKFFDILNRMHGLPVNAVVIVATTRAIDIHGLENLRKHCEIIERLGIKPVVALNRFKGDKKTALDSVAKFCKSNGIVMEMNEAYLKGGQGCERLAKKVLASVNGKPEISPVYKLSDAIEVKAMKAVREVFGGADVRFSDEAREKAALFTGWGYSKLPICIAKTQYSLSDDKNRPGVPKDFTLRITDARLSAGAGFIVLYCGNILTMPGMPSRG